MAKKIIVIGGGAAGMMAAACAARNGHEVHLLEKNEKVGKKLYITGKGRCNLTNACDVETLLKNVVTNPKFLYSAFYGFSSSDMIELLENTGLKLKVERGNRVFPASDKSSDVIRTLTELMEEAGVRVHLDCHASQIRTMNGHICGVVSSVKGEQKFWSADAVILAAGGKAYPSTGSTGDGYTLACALGHTVRQPLPALVPLNIKEDWCTQLMGLSLRNISVRFVVDSRCVYQDFGEILFTHFGVSGPLALSASSYISSLLAQGKTAEVHIDLKPALSMQQLDMRLRRDFEMEKNRHFSNSLHRLLPAKLIPVVVERVGIPAEKKVNLITKEERRRLALLLKDFTLTATGTRGFNEAVITQGGVCVKEVKPATMESKLIGGLYFAGEILDVDALTGGFNLQIAWSTGWTAAQAAGDSDGI